MDSAVREKVERVLKGELKYKSSNLAFNMMISKLQKKLEEDPSCMEPCMNELDKFLEKYSIVAKVDLANIAAL